MSATFQRIALARRPQGHPIPEDFNLRTEPMPEPGDGEVLVEVTHLSLDPYMRGRMDDVKSYAPSVEIGGTMTGQGVGRVLASRADGFSEGDLVTGMTGWASHACLPGTELRTLSDDLPPSTALGVLGMPGLTGWVGLNRFGMPKAGETLVVAAATGPVGSMVGQLAKAAGLRTVAIAGGPEKCALARDTFGFDAAIDHRAHDSASDLRKAIAAEALDGVDITLDDWDRLGRDVPTIVNLMPSGKHLMEEFFYAGGLPVVIRKLNSSTEPPGVRLPRDGRVITLAMAPRMMKSSLGNTFRFNAGKKSS